MSNLPDEFAKSLQLTAEDPDPRYNRPFIEVDEEGAEPVPHRYVRGGFEGTDARFSFYFPPKEQYEGRFFHNTYPLAVTSDIAPFPIQFDVAVGNLPFTIASGAYYVQTNNGGADFTEIGDPAILGYRVNAAAAKYSREVARRYYGDHRPYGYLFGGSGGSYQVMGAAENTTGIWDGFLPYVCGTPTAIPSMFTVRLHALRMLRQRDKWPAVIEAIYPGGSGDPYAGLNEEEAAGLREAVLLGYPLRGWWNHDALNSGYLPFNLETIRGIDPTYADDFWSKPGYLGTDPKSTIGSARVQFETTIAEVIDGPQKQIRLAEVPDKDFADSYMEMLSGEAQGQRFILGNASANPIGFSVATHPSTLGGIKAGDKVRIDNSWILALQTYQHHQVPELPELYGWNQFRGEDGKPLYPQRPVLVGPASMFGVTGAIPDGAVTAKTLVLEVLMDIDALPWQADWYRSRAKAHLGDKFDDTFAIWFIDDAQHDDPQSVKANAYSVSFSGALQQGLRDLAAWAEKGVRPSSTNYAIVDTQVRVPDRASERMGPQATATLRANGAAAVAVDQGKPVTFTAALEMPPGAGRLVEIEWDFEGLGTYPESQRISPPAQATTISAEHRYERPGTYYAVIRVTSQRDGDPETPFGRIQCLAHARIDVK